MSTELPADYFGRLFPGEPLVVTMFDAGELRRTPQRGRVWLSSWPWLIVWSESPAVEANKADAGGITFARCKDGVRRKSHVEAVTALVIDHDLGKVTPAEATDSLKRYTHVLHTTASHTVEAPRWRAVIQVSRTMTADEYALVWSHAADALACAGIPIDPSAKDPCRLWYSPSVKHIGAPWEHYAHDGVPVDVDAVLAKARECEERAKRPAPKPVTPEHRDQYAAGALRRAAAAVQEATPGERHYTLCKEAHSLARDELGLTESEIKNALAPAFVNAAGECRAREGERTIGDAIRARKKGS